MWMFLFSSALNLLVCLRVHVCAIVLACMNRNVYLQAQANNPTDRQIFRVSKSV